MDAGAVQVNRPHRVSSKKTKQKKKTVSWETPDSRDGASAGDARAAGPERKAVAKPGNLTKKVQIAAERGERRAKSDAHQVDRSGGDDVPNLVAVVGPAGVGKSTIIRNLVKHYTRRNIGAISGPITVVVGRKRRLTFVEVGPDLSSMVDAAKVADLVLLAIDASFGFEMETFEFLNIAAAHGMPRVMGVLTHLDSFKEGKKVQRTKKRLKARFWTELYDGAKLFYLSGITTSGSYLKREVLNLARFISVTKFRPLKWRNEHPYVLADRVEDLTRVENESDTANRRVVFYGFLRGAPLRLIDRSWLVHIPGVGDMKASEVEALPDPCPTPESLREDKTRRRKIGEKERSIHAPMAVELDGIAYDKDAVYISVPDGPNASDGENEDEDVMSEDQEQDGLMGMIGKARNGLDGVVRDSELQIIAGGRKIVSKDFVQKPIGKDQRQRRPAFVDGDDIDHHGLEDNTDDASQSSDDEVDDEDQDVESIDNGDSDGAENSDEDGTRIESEDDEESDSDNDANQKWKSQILESAKTSFEGQASLSRQIYSNPAPAGLNGRTSNTSKVESLFTREIEEDEEDPDLRLDYAVVTDWCALTDSRISLRASRFATGAQLGDGEDAEVAYGDFEDLEVQNQVEAVAEQAEGDDETDVDEQFDVNDSGDTNNVGSLRRKKEEKKLMFDSAWDKKEGDDPERPHESDDNARVEFDAQRAPELNGLDEKSREAVAGVSPGSYVRLVIESVPVEFVRYFDPQYPVVIGGVKSNEDVRLTYLMARVKRHRWHRGVLKSGDPIIFSVGWRRFQSVPVYSIEDANKRVRFLKYTPEHMHCGATFWGPSTAPGTGIVMVRRLDRTNASFRVGGTGVVTELLPTPRVVKKLKLVGEPFKVLRNTAFVKNMFNSDLEVSKFVGASIRTVSGIRGSIKKALRSSGGERAVGPPGSFRGTFEDKLVMTDLVFLRAWVPVTVPAHWEVAATLLQEQRTSEESAVWRMRTVRELREAKGVAIPRVGDSLKRDVVRVERKFRPLKIPQKLEEALPYASRPKLTPARKKGHAGERERALAVVVDGVEKKERTMLQMVRTIGNEKERKRKESAAKARAERAKKLEKEAEKHRLGEARRRKRRYVTEGQAQERDRKRAQLGH